MYLVSVADKIPSAVTESPEPTLTPPRVVAEAGGRTVAALSSLITLLVSRTYSRSTVGLNASVHQTLLVPLYSGIADCPAAGSVVDQVVPLSAEYRTVVVASA